MCLVPVLVQGDPATQMMAVSTTMLGGLVLQTPKLATAGLQLILTSAALSTDKVADEELMSIRGTAPVCSGFGAVVVVLVVAACQRQRPSRRFDFFGCHHKEDASAQARLLKCIMKAMKLEVLTRFRRSAAPGHAVRCGPFQSAARHRVPGERWEQVSDVHGRRAHGVQVAPEQARASRAMSSPTSRGSRETVGGLSCERRADFEDPEVGTLVRHERAVMELPTAGTIKALSQLTATVGFMERSQVPAIPVTTPSFQFPGAKFFDTALPALWTGDVLQAIAVPLAVNSSIGVTEAQSKSGTLWHSMCQSDCLGLPVLVSSLVVRLWTVIPESLHPV